MSASTIGPSAIFTASWSTNVPREFVRVGISRGTPRRHPAGYRRYRPLQPGPWLRVPTEEFIRRYENEILGVLDVDQVLRDLARIGEGRPIALVCFELCGTIAGWCHRGLVSRYLEREAGLKVFEYGFEVLGCGEQHPLLAAAASRQCRLQGSKQRSR